jgi:glucan 1,3-beta-glucosidase
MARRAVARLGCVLLLLLSTTLAASSSSCTTWYDTTPHGPSFRNALDFGAVGDGVHDDTLALQSALDFNQTGEDGTHFAKSPAILYLPPGTYRVSDTIVLWFWSHLVGSPCAPPTILLSSTAPGFDGNGTRGLHKPILAANSGFNVSAQHHAWWLHGKFLGGNANDHFYAQIRDVNIVVEQGGGAPDGATDGVVGILWPVAQQTSIRGVTIDLGAARYGIGIDEGGADDYIHSFLPSLTQGGGGLLDNITIRGGQIGLRVAASQWSYVGLTISGASSACVDATHTLWAQTFVGLVASNCPAAVAFGPATGTLSLLDSTLGPGLGAAAVTVAAASYPPGPALYLQNVDVVIDGPGGTEWVVTDLLAVAVGEGTTRVPAWAAGAVYTSGKNASAGVAGYTRLPSSALAAAQGLPLACRGTAGQPTLCGGAREDAATGFPSAAALARPTVPGATIRNVVKDYGAVGDGVHDDTLAFQQALAASPPSPLFVPFGTYLLSDTLHLPCGTTLVGEGLATLALAAAAPGFGDNATLKPMLQTAAAADTGAADCPVVLLDLSLTTLGPGNDGALLLDWAAGPTGGLWDVTVRLYFAVGLKARFGARGGGGGGSEAAPTGAVLSNTWFWAADHNLTDLYEMNCSAPLPACPDHRPPDTPLGIRVEGGSGPWLLLGTNMEHSLVREYALVGAQNVLATAIQTEATPQALVLNDTTLVTVFGALFTRWTPANPPDRSLAAAARGPGTCVAADGVDLAYRLTGMLARGATDLFVDLGREGDGGQGAFELPAGAGPGGWSGAAVIGVGC